jgi:arylsulfatase A-like enzyme
VPGARRRERLPRAGRGRRQTGAARYRIGGAAVGLLVVLATGAYLYRSAHRPPLYNVLLISLYTVRQDALGCYGRRPRHAPTLSPSPALDELARQGVRMVDAYGSSSWTLPSHLSMMTGQPPLIHAVETESGMLDQRTPTLAEILKAQGYGTAGIYSAPYLEPHWGFGRGFDQYDAMYAPDVLAASQRASEIRQEVDRAAAAADWAQYDRLKQRQAANEDDLDRSSERASTSDQVTAAALAHLERFARDGRPWLLFAHFFDAHCDYVPPPPYDTRFDPDYAGSFTGRNCLRDASVALPDPDSPGGLIRTLSDRDLEHVIALYEGEVAWVDAHVGTLLRALDTLGLAQTTLVIVVADHGEEFFDHGNLGHRHTLYEESVRVPMVLRLPGVLPAGASIRGPVAVTDILPTVLDILHLPAAATPGARHSCR